MSQLPLIPHILGLLLAVGLGLAHARRLHRTRPDITTENGHRHLPHLWVLLGITVLLTGSVYWLITRPIGVQARYPLWMLDAAPILLWGAILLLFGYFFALTLGLAFNTREKSRYTLLFACVLAIATVEVSHAKATRQLWPELTHTTTDNGAILQSSGATCAAASGANIAIALGLEATEIDVAKAMHTTSHGTSTGQMVRGMREIGITCEPFSLDPEDPRAIPTPSIVFVPVAGNIVDGHAIAVLEQSEDLVRTIDPLSGRVDRAPDSMVGHWGGRGVHCRLAD